MFGKIMDKCDNAYLGCKIRAERAKDELVKQTDGMETLQVVIIIIIALAVAGVVYAIANKITSQANTDATSFLQKNSMGTDAGVNGTN